MITSWTNLVPGAVETHDEGACCAYAMVYRSTVYGCLG
jgi:hypothetical protein